MQKDKVYIQDGQFERVLAVAFAPVVALTELIKNSSDACMIPNDKIEIHIDKPSQEIRIIDNGYGFSCHDIKNLHNIGFSSKMRDGNTVSHIGEPFAGSKGLGILTAFNLCDKLEIFTFSQDDQKSYHIIWEKGTAEISWEELQEHRRGSEFILHGVSTETFQLILLREELTKLYFSSIRSCIDNKNLPKIELFCDGIQDESAPEVKLEDLYQKNKRAAKGFFVAKASFRYSKNRLLLSYEDNAKDIFNFKDAEIELTNLSSIQSFSKIHGIVGLNLRDEVEEFDSDSKIDDFSGVYYIWRGSRDAIKNYPPGVRIYINNYGLYNYLNSEFDWLQHSEISQSIKATNYKLKNTYGFISFYNYDEDSSALKISNERNDFLETLAKKKFLYIMRKFVSAIFSKIDMNIKNYNRPDNVIFQKKSNAKKRVIEGDELSLNDLILTNLSSEDILITVPNGVLFDNLDVFTFQSAGKYQLCFVYGEKSITVPITVEDSAPYFELKASRIKINENNHENLDKYIKNGSLKNISLDQIKIESDDAKISSGKIFAANNTPGTYFVRYKYSDEMTRTLEVNVIPMNSRKSDRIKDLFPYRCKKYPKISDIIFEIANMHVRCPSICAISLRPLIECSLKAFINEFYTDDEKLKLKKDKDFNVEGKLCGFFNHIETGKLQNLPTAVLDKYKDTLVGHRKQVSKAYKDLDLNSNIHDPETFSSEREVVTFIRKLKPFFNFIIESLNSKTE